MTKERAIELGIWTRWEAVSCQVCGVYTNYGELVEALGGIVCLGCEKTGRRKADEKMQAQLFDDQATLF